MLYKRPKDQLRILLASDVPEKKAIKITIKLFIAKLEKIMIKLQDMSIKSPSFEKLSKITSKLSNLTEEYKFISDKYDIYNFSKIEEKFNDCKTSLKKAFIAVMKTDEESEDEGKKELVMKGMIAMAYIINMYETKIISVACKYLIDGIDDLEEVIERKAKKYELLLKKAFGEDVPIDLSAEKFSEGVHELID